MNECRVRIVMHNHGWGEVFINDEKVPGVKKFEARAEAAETNALVLHLIPNKIEIDGVFDVTTIESIVRECVIGSADK